jgi:uncharacterized membrane protein YedE/YeeE
MAVPPSKSMAQALLWISRITTVGLEMVVPAIVGGMLDRYFDTKFLAVSGLVFGVVAGFWHLIMMTRPPSRPAPPGKDDPSS